MRWNKFFERKFLIAVGGVVTGTLLAFGQPDQADAFDKVLGSFISMGMALGWIAAETSRDNSRDRTELEKKARELPRTEPQRKRRTGAESQ
jgi:hypothetical protein